MSIFEKIASCFDISKLKIQRKPQVEKSIVKDVMSNPDKYKLEAFVDGDEIVVKIKKNFKMEAKNGTEKKA